MANVTVRQATIFDLPELVPLFDSYRQFYERLSDVAGAHAFLLERFRHAESVIFLAHEGSEPVGFTQLYPSFSSASMARIFILNDLFVREDARGKGVSTKLMGAATAFAKAAGAVRLTLSTAVTNTHAQAVYESLGWRRDELFYVYNFAQQG
jgi:GNAT superfamily N-acetyltransferase